MCYSEEEMPRVAKDKVEKDIIENVKTVGEAVSYTHLRAHET